MGRASAARCPVLSALGARQSVPSLITSATLLSLGSTMTICCAVRKNLWLFTCGTFWLTSLGIGRGLTPGGIGSPLPARTTAPPALLSLPHPFFVGPLFSLR